MDVRAGFLRIQPEQAVLKTGHIAPYCVADPKPAVTKQENQSLQASSVIAARSLAFGDPRLRGKDSEHFAV
jgi:hypothetical protein